MFALPFSKSQVWRLEFCSVGVGEQKAFGCILDQISNLHLPFPFYRAVHHRLSGDHSAQPSLVCFCLFVLFICFCFALAFPSPEWL